MSLVNDHQLPRLVHQKLAVIHRNLVRSHHDRKRKGNSVLVDCMLACNVSSQQHTVWLGTVIQYVRDLTTQKKCATRNRG